MRSRYLGLSLLVFILITAAVMFPSLGKLSRSQELRTRQNHLAEWYRGIRTFTTEEGRLPSSLYEVAYQTGFSLPMLVSSSTTVNNLDIKQLFADPNYFIEKANYLLFTSGKNYFIMETQGSKRNPNQLMIDDRGRIFELRLQIESGVD